MAIASSKPILAGAPTHIACRVCGVTPFYVPRSNPDGYAVTLWCVERSTIKSVEVKQFDGQNWEQHLESSGIASMSKE